MTGFALFTKENAALCPVARYVGGTSGWLCECRQPHSCKGIITRDKK